MATHEIEWMHARACVVVGTASEGSVSCPSCGETIGLEQGDGQAGRVSVACPRCAEESLLVRVVSVLHRAVRFPAELMTQLGRELEAAARPVVPSVRTPAEVYSLPVSRGAVVLLAMMWHRAEQSGSTRIESSVAQLSRRLLTSRGMVRAWLGELQTAGVLREASSPGQRPRAWELLPVPRKEAGHG